MLCNGNMGLAAVPGNSAWGEEINFSVFDGVPLKACYSPLWPVPRLDMVALSVRSLLGSGWSRHGRELFLCLSPPEHTGADRPAAWQATGRWFKCVCSINGSDTSQLFPLTLTTEDGSATRCCIAVCGPWGSCGVPKLSACSQPFQLPPFFCTHEPCAVKLPGFPSSHLLPGVYCA